MHDHPFAFISIILAGGYYEWRPISSKQLAKRLMEGKELVARPYGRDWEIRTWHGPGSILRRHATDVHRIELDGEKAATTLVLRGRHVRQWGFVTIDGEWIAEADYDGN